MYLKALRYCVWLAELFRQLSSILPRKLLSHTHQDQISLSVCDWKLPKFAAYRRPLNMYLIIVTGFTAKKLWMANYYIAVSNCPIWIIVQLCFSLKFIFFYVDKDDGLSLIMPNPLLFLARSSQWKSRLWGALWCSSSLGRPYKSNKLKLAYLLGDSTAVCLSWHKTNFIN